MRGYIYVLVNSSLPGLVKVGKTMRLPSERVQELSGATGVPTPFIVAFEQEFGDCDAAERFVHAQLEHMGLRQAMNREFFRAPPADVIRIILRAPDTVSDLGSSNDPESEGRGKEPWADLIDEAREHEYGDNGRLHDPTEALRLYQLAAKLGSGNAHWCIGNQYKFGEGVREDESQALYHYKEAVRLGFFFAYPSMSGIFANQGHRENYVKCAQLFVDAWKADGGATYWGSSSTLDSGLWTIMQQAYKVPGGYPAEDMMRERAGAILAHHQKNLRDWAVTDPGLASRTTDRTKSETAWLKAASGAPATP